MATARMYQEEAMGFIRKLGELVYKVSRINETLVEVEYCAPCCDGCETPYSNKYGSCEDRCPYFLQWESR